MGFSESTDQLPLPRRRWGRQSRSNRRPDRRDPNLNIRLTNLQDTEDNLSRNSTPPPNMSAVRRLLAGSQSDSTHKMRNAKASAKQHAISTPTHPPPPSQCVKCATLASRTKSIAQQATLLRSLSKNCISFDTDRLEAALQGDYHALTKLFDTACQVQAIIGTDNNRDKSMTQLRSERLKVMGITLYGTESNVTLVSNGAGILIIFQREGINSLMYEGVQFDIAVGEETPVDLVLKAVLENNNEADLDDLNAILSSIKFCKHSEDADAIEDINSGGLSINGLKFTRAEFYTTRVLCMMMKTDIYEEGFYRKYVHIDRLGTTFTALREGETSTLTKINVLPDALSRPVRCATDILGEDLFMARRKGRKDRFRLSCSVSVNIWEEYEAAEWFGYIHPPPNADAIRPASLVELKERLESYGIPDGAEVCRLVYHCLGHKSRNANVKVDTLSAARGYFMYLKNFLKHGTTGTQSNHIIEGNELAVVYDGIAYRVSAPQSEIRHRSLFHSLLLSDERERNGKNVPKRSVIRRMCSTSEVVLSLCRDITYLNAEYDEEGGTLYSASAEEENVAEAWATCMALYVCDGYGCLEGCFNCAIENRRGAIVDEMAVFTNDVQVPVVFDKLYRKSSIAEEMSGMSDARGATYPGAFVSGRDQCNERTFLAGSCHRLTKKSLQSVLQLDFILQSTTMFMHNEDEDIIDLTLSLKPDMKISSYNTNLLITWE